MAVQIRATRIHGEREYGIHAGTHEIFFRPIYWENLTDKFEAAWRKPHPDKHERVPKSISAELRAV